MRLGFALMEVGSGQGGPLRVRGQPGRTAGGRGNSPRSAFWRMVAPACFHCYLEHREQNGPKVIFQVSRWV